MGYSLIFWGIFRTRYIIPDTAYCCPLFKDLDLRKSLFGNQIPGYNQYTIGTDNLTSAFKTHLAAANPDGPAPIMAMVSAFRQRSAGIEPMALTKKIRCGELGVQALFGPIIFKTLLYLVLSMCIGVRDKHRVTS